MKKMAFVYLSDYEKWPMGGMLSYVRNMIPYLTDHQDISSDFWGCSINGKNKCYFRIGNKKYNLHIYTNAKTQKKIIPNFVMSFINAIKNHKNFTQYDIIYSHTAATTIAIKFMFPRKFVVHHQHGLSYVNSKGYMKILNIGYMIAQFMADMSFFVASDEELQKYKAQYPFFKRKSFFAIGSPVDYSYIANVKTECSKVTRFIYTGRIDTWKNVRFIIDAFSLYRKKKNSELIIIGDGPDYNDIAAYIAEKKENSWIHMWGRKKYEEVIQCLKSCDVFLFASKGEGISISILEALSAGLPVVALDAIGVRNLVKHNITGFLIKNHSLEKYTKAMEIAANHKQQMKPSCMAFAHQFSSDLISNMIIDLIVKEYDESTK